MPNCDYCEESFATEDAYLEHLAADHEGELGSIDRRRVEESRGGGDDGDGLPIGVIAVGAIVLVALGALAYVFVFSGPDGVEGRSLQNSGDADRLEDVESFPSEGRQHVAAGTDIDYERVPPLSGPHYDATAAAGFYEETPPLGELVHTLEHGAVIVYYDPAALDDDAEESLQQFASQHTGTWQSFLAVPNPNDDPEAAYVLTAWRHRLSVDDYDAETVYAFLSEYLGRGPENTVR